MDKNRVLSKEEFLQNYVLNRARTAGNLDGRNAAMEAVRAWNFLRTESSKEEKLL